MTQYIIIIILLLIPHIYYYKKSAIFIQGMILGVIYYFPIYAGGLTSLDYYLGVLYLVMSSIHISLFLKVVIYCNKERNEYGKIQSIVYIGIMIICLLFMFLRLGELLYISSMSITGEIKIPNSRTIAGLHLMQFTDEVKYNYCGMFRTLIISPVFEEAVIFTIFGRIRLKKNWWYILISLVFLLSHCQNYTYLISEYRSISIEYFHGIPVFTITYILILVVLRVINKLLYMKTMSIIYPIMFHLFVNIIAILINRNIIYALVVHVVARWQFL